jgi:hypothetical protein
MDNMLESFNDEQKKYIVDLVITTVKEIREQIALDIQYTAEVWQQYGKVKSRRTKQAFEVSAAIARGENEIAE